MVATDTLTGTTDNGTLSGLTQGRWYTLKVVLNSGTGTIKFYADATEQVPYQIWDGSAMVDVSFTGSGAVDFRAIDPDVYVALTGGTSGNFTISILDAYQA